jgi:hypothetical protein
VRGEWEEGRVEEWGSGAGEEDELCDEIKM